MHAIRQTYEDAPPAIPVPDEFRHKRLEVILFVQEDSQAIPDIPPAGQEGIGSGCEEAFFLLAGLSDDFMAEGRKQLPLQERDDF